MASLSTGAHDLDRERRAGGQHIAYDGAVLLGESGSMNLGDRCRGERLVVERRE